MGNTIKEQPWIAKKHEAQAIASGRKTQLRILAPVFEGKDLDKLLAQHPNQKGCPLGEVGDRLRVREPWFAMRYDWRELGTSAPFLYCDGFISNRAAWGETYQGMVPPVGHAWKSAASMPRDASRFLLEITAVRVERLINISTADAIAEGIEPVLCPTTGTVPAKKWKNYMGRAYQDGMSLNYATESYLSLWNSISTIDAHLINPWVWVVEFKVISPTLEKQPAQ